MHHGGGASVRSRPVRRSDVAGCAGILEGVVESIFEVLEGLAGRLELAWRDTAAGDRAFSTAELAELQPFIFASLDARPEFDSAGYVMDGEALCDRDRYLEWWHRSERASFQPLILNLDLSSPDNYDYYSMEWFVAARREHRRFVSGPLIDLPCAESHIMTFSHPVLVDRRFLGIAGADVAMSRLEALIVPPMLRLAAPSVLVNGHRRVIAATDARWASGDKLKQVPSESDEWQVTATVSQDLGWMLAVPAD